MPGPPLVSISGQVKISNAPMNPVAEAMNVAGDSIGSVIRRNRVQAPAPSIDAASYSSPGIDCSPTRKMMNVNPRVAQTSMMTSDGSDQVPEASQFGGGGPILRREDVSGPGGA